MCLTLGVFSLCVAELLTLIIAERKKEQRAQAALLAAEQAREKQELEQASRQAQNKSAAPHTDTKRKAAATTKRGRQDRGEIESESQSDAKRGKTDTAGTDPEETIPPKVPSTSLQAGVRVLLTQVVSRGSSAVAVAGGVVYANQGARRGADVVPEGMVSRGRRALWWQQTHACTKAPREHKKTISKISSQNRKNS